MGIKGIYKEIGTGQRVSLTKLAISKLEDTGRPFRLAIDISIWQFQAQAARGGANPAIRTVFYRLLRLLSLGIEPIFVFDGPHKPAFKRNKRSGRGDGLSSAMAKRLINLFGCVAHDAPGEAEAECALMQREGLVDAVLSEDVDTIMFGCTKTLRNWSAGGTKGSKVPTHISVYDIEKILHVKPGLDREGMVLVALMSGGDYIPEGIPGAGIKLACEAADAGFGTALCKLKRSDTSGLASWKEWFKYELTTNESGFFRVRHKALTIPDDFPNFDILRYYTHPVVSPQSVLDALRQKQWSRPMDVLGLREFARETFDWNYRAGAFKFIRVMAPPVLTRQLLDRSKQHDHRPHDIEILELEEKGLIKAISSRREHFSTDATPELRISFIPTNVVGHAFEEEPEEVIETARDGLALNSDVDDDPEDGEVESTTRSGGKKPFSPTEPELIWLPESIAKLGVPITVEDWESAQRAKVARKTQKSQAAASKTKKTPAANTAKGSLDKFVRVTKALPRDNTSSKEKAAPSVSQSLLSNPASETQTPFSSTSARLSKSSMPPPASQPLPTSKIGRPSKQSRSTTTRNAPLTGPKLDSSTNPWTIAGSQVSPRVARTNNTADEPILIASSPLASPCARSAPCLVEYGGKRAQATSEDFTGISHKRRSVTPPSELQRNRNQSPRASSPTPQPQKRTLRKLARTESMPAAPTPDRSAADDLRPRRAGFARAHTIAADIVELDDSNSDDDLPSIETIAGKIPSKVPTASKPSDSPRRLLFSSPAGPSSPKTTTRSSHRSTTNIASPYTSPSKSTRISTTTTVKPGVKAGAITRPAGQTTLEDAFGPRMTKMYVPSTRTPGFYKEIDVTVDEAEAFKDRQGSLEPSRREKAWRRSDISCIDLTDEP